MRVVRSSRPISSGDLLFRRYSSETQHLLIILSLLCIAANAEDFPPTWSNWSRSESEVRAECDSYAQSFPDVKFVKFFQPPFEIMACQSSSGQFYGLRGARSPSCDNYPGAALVYENGTAFCRGPNPCKEKADKFETISGLFLEGEKAKLSNWPDINPRCNSGCVVAPTVGATPIKCLQHVENGKTMVSCQKSYMYNGNRCSANDKPMPGSHSNGTPPPTSCDPAKQDKINLNGKDICVNKSTGKEVNPTTGEDADGEKKHDKDLKKDKTPDGKDRTTETERIKNPDGSITEKRKETVCDSSGNCKTTETEKTTGKGDSETEKDPDRDKQDDFCKKNPNKKICEEKNKFNDGNCPTPPSCEGDAIQCGIAQKVHKANCDADKRHKDMYESDAANQGYSTYNGMKAENGAAGNSKGSAIGIREINLGNSGSLNWEVFQPSGTCPFIRSTVTLAGSGLIPGITTDFDPSILCQYGPALSRIIILSTMLACAFMFMRKI